MDTVKALGKMPLFPQMPNMVLENPSRTETSTVSTPSSESLSSQSNASVSRDRKRKFTAGTNHEAKRRVESSPVHFFTDNLYYVSSICSLLFSSSSPRTSGLLQNESECLISCLVTETDLLRQHWLRQPAVRKPRIRDFSATTPRRISSSPAVCVVGAKIESKSKSKSKSAPNQFNDDLPETANNTGPEQ